MAGCPRLQPGISSFSASPDTIAPGASSTLSWKVSAADAVTIDHGVGAVTGSSVSVTPTATTSYTLTATNASGRATATTQVTVTVPVPAAIALPATGLTLCFDPETNAVIPCQGTGQDGELRRGVAWPVPRFDANGDGTVTDNLTGLIWLQYGICAANHGPISDSGVASWRQAMDFVAKMNDGTYADCAAGHHDWRLPNRNEMRSLANYSRSGLADSPFSGVQPYGCYMSSTWPWSTWSPTGADGQMSGTIDALQGFIWPVRGESDGPARLATTGRTRSLDSTTPWADDGALQKGVAWPSPRFTANKDAGGLDDGTVTDRLTGLIWLKDARCPGTIQYNPDSDGFGRVSWKHALEFIAGINAGTYAACGAGHGDWRLPNAIELASLLHSGFKDEVCGSAGHPEQCLHHSDWLNSQGFSVEAGFYWSSTSRPSAIARAADMTDGAVGNYVISLGYVWPVRGGP
jgi:hypothetical protein